MHSTTHRLCICGTFAERQPFSEHFDVHICPSCKTQQFHANGVSVVAEFKYDETNDKYSQAAYLHGRELRWSHQELLKLDWTGRKTLEIGCFNGFFVDELRARGADAYGVDVNKAALEAGNQMLALQGHLFGSVDEARALGPFDDVLCIDVVEHVDDPEGFLAMVSGLLTPTGRIHVAGPTLERRFFDKSDYPPHHKWRFSRPGLVQLLERGGFKASAPVVQYDGLLMLRNWIGKQLNGRNRKEFYGDVTFNAPPLSSRMSRSAYAFASRLGELLFNALGISYCSSIVTGSRAK
jgi:SAM-dependent methyltransferase